MKTFLTYLGILLGSASHTVMAKTIHVCKDCSHTTIGSALAQAKDKDTLKIHPGTYKEGQIIISKKLTIIGINYPVLDGEDKNEILTITVNDVAVAGLIFRNSGKSSLNDLAAIKLQKVSRVNVMQNRFEDNYFAIYLSNCNNCIVSGNKIQGSGLSQQGSGNGIHLWKCDQIKIENNECRGHRDGIYFEFVSASSIINNISEANLRYGLHFMFSDNDQYEGNTFRNNGAGVAVMYSKKVKMKNNRFLYNWGSGAYGILLKDIRDSEIIWNTFEGNTTAIYAESASRIIITKNSFVRNGWALRITSSCDGLHILVNNFTANTFDMASTSANHTTENTYDGNYWDKYEGYDLNRDKIGDVAYYPVSLSTLLVEKIPTSAYFLHSFVLNLIDQSERMLPGLIPEGIRDNAPLMKKLQL